MKDFETLEISWIDMPTTSEVLVRIQRDEPCCGNLLSPYCTFMAGKDDYLLKDEAGSTECRRCPVFAQKLGQMEADWEEWVLAVLDAYST